MKSKNISFAEVLKKNTKSPRMDFTAKNSSLFSLFEEYESNPDQDYTLYLAQTNHSQRGKLKSFQLQHSKYTNQQQQELFDSWIQKQSFVTSNKQNIRTQSKKVPVNEKVKKSEGFKRIQPSSRSKGDFYLSNQANSKQMERSSKASQPYQENFTPLHIEMIKSKGYEPSQNLQRVNSPKSKFNLQKNTNQNIQPNTYRGVNKLHDQKLLPEMIKKSTKQIQKEPQQVYQKPKIQAQSFKSFTKINESVQSLKIQEDITNITKKYMDQKYLAQDQDDLEDEQLLLQNSNFPFSRNESEKTQNVIQKNEQKYDKSEQINKKRIEQAKNIIGDYFNNIKKAKRPDQHYEANDFQSDKFENRNQSNSAHQGVGYSFSTTFQQNERKEYKKQVIKPIQQLQHENPNESLNDSDFRLKYLNLRSSEAVEENQYIQNIQSVRYDDFSQRDNQINAPYDSFKVKLILSNDKQNDVSKNHQQNISTHQKEERIQIVTKQKDSLQMKKSLQSVTTKPLGKSRQKISLISSNKSKTSSNKASPKMPLNSQKQPQITTTDFNMQTNLQQKKSIQTKTYFNSFLEHKRQENKYLRDEKPIYQIKKEVFVPPKEMEKPKQQQKLTSPKQVKSSIGQHLASASPLSNYSYSKPAYPGYATYITSPSLPPSNASTYTTQNVMTPTYATATPSTNISTIMKTSNFNSSIERTYYATSNEPTYGNNSKNQILGAKAYAYSPMKTQNSYTQEYIKEQIKKENSPHVFKPIVPQSSTSYEQKYALPQSFSDKQKGLGKNYLSKLEIKESINLIESKTQKQMQYKQNIQLGSNKTSYMNTFGKDQKNSNPIFSNSGLGSLKQSINVSEGDQFTFDL